MSEPLIIVLTDKEPHEEVILDLDAFTSLVGEQVAERPDGSGNVVSLGPVGDGVTALAAATTPLPTHISETGACHVVSAATGAHWSPPWQQGRVRHLQGVSYAPTRRSLAERRSAVGRGWGPAVVATERVMRSALRRSDACLSNGRTEAKAGDRTAPSAANFRSREVDSELWAEHRTGARTTNTICHCTKRTRRRQAAEHTPCCGSPGRTSAPRRTPMGGRGLERETSDGLDLPNGVTSEIHTASFKFDSRLSHRVGVGACDRRGGFFLWGRTSCIGAVRCS